MSIKITVRQLLDSFQVLERIAAIHLSGEQNRRNSRTLADARLERDVFVDKRLKLYQLYGEQTGPQDWTITDPQKWAAFTRALEDRLAEEVTLRGEPFTLTADTADYALFSGAEMLAIDWLVTFVDEEEEKAETKAAGA